MCHRPQRGKHHVETITVILAALALVGPGVFRPAHADEMLELRACCATSVQTRMSATSTVCGGVARFSGIASFQTDRPTTYFIATIDYVKGSGTDRVTPTLLR
jgi:hypothetical protein